MTASTQPTETRAQTTNGSFQTDADDLQEAIVDVQRWSDQHDHPVAERFQGGEQA